MRIKAFILFLMCFMLILTGCGNNQPESSDDSENWGSFTADISYSYDGRYYAVQEVEYPDELINVKYVKVSVYDTETDEPIFSFYPARAFDFWGICWESDSYNIWIQSGDIGIRCYRYDNMKWILDESAQRPDDIVSKYDE